MQDCDPSAGEVNRQGRAFPLPCPPEADPPVSERERTKLKIPPEAGVRVISEVNEKGPLGEVILL